MIVKDIIAEDFCNYKKPSMFIISSVCNWKCCIEQGLDVAICQNSSLAQQPSRNCPDELIYKQFIANDITQAVVVGGLEPILQIDGLVNLIKLFRENGSNCPFIIYTGYYPTEIENELNRLKSLNNIIIKYGRYIPNRPSRYDEVLGINLVSDNQYAEVLC